MNSLVQQFLRREAHPGIQFIKYGICGVIATAVHITIFYVTATALFPAITGSDPAAGLLERFGLTVKEVEEAVRARNAMIDNAIAFIFSNLTAYLLNIAWVFKAGRHHRVLEIGMFYLVSGVSIVIGTALMGILIHKLGLSTTVAFTSNLVTSTMINFVMRKFVIFHG